ncbi:hypothetical protein [Candidatus Contubernalis alkaliaceticus]|uniref:hypothetical protein n=1 Tax=Candidatus Contubernalis alkaliaceticus TaxID=338645 RepID=UPI001F4C0D7C|nr:hypothetical protein [Candidatus Contubernalis alkalaceticus]UNC93434.1 hypothetical protein HUE98_15930 [Candidatus Contubernalis alkalaceticus]
MSMEKNCPMCSGSIRPQENCYQCGSPLEDRGVLSSHLDRYAPDADQNFFQLTQEEETITNSYCTHLLYCSKCQEGITRSIKK